MPRRVPAPIDALLPRLPSLADIMRGRRMILRILNLVVIGALVLAAAYVYRIKFDSTVQAERLAKLRGEVRHERDTHRGAARRVGRARQSGAHRGARQALSAAQADRADAVRHARSSARSSAAIHQARQHRSDRRHDRESGRTRLDDRQHSRRRPRRPTTAPAPTPAPARSGSVERDDRGRRKPYRLDRRREPWRRQLRAQRCSTAQRSIAPPRRGRGSGLAILAFAVVYAIIAVRLVMFARRVRQPHRRIASSPAMRSRPRVRIFSIATARFWRPMCACRRSTPSRAA